MKESIIKEIVSNRELSDSPLLLSWINESDENRDSYIAYKNSYALTQSGAEMKESEILKGLNFIKEPKGKSKIRSLTSNFYKYAAILVLAIVGLYGYHLISIDSSALTSMNVISVSDGSRSVISLPDGTEVILVNGSKITYPTNFSAKAREVSLEGEAFMNVAHNKKKPFKVNMGAHQIEVLGTEFLVTAYPQDNNITVDLVSGKVKMNIPKQSDTSDYASYLLSPNESLQINKSNGDVNFMKTYDEFYKFWKYGEYVFNKESFNSLANKLERIYHVSVKFEDDILRSCSFTGALYSKFSINKTLDTFKKASSIPFEYTIENNTIYIKTEK